MCIVSSAQRSDQSTNLRAAEHGTLAAGRGWRVGQGLPLARAGSLFPSRARARAPAAELRDEGIVRVGGLEGLVAEAEREPMRRMRRTLRLEQPPRGARALLTGSLLPCRDTRRRRWGRRARMGRRARSPTPWVGRAPSRRARRARRRGAECVRLRGVVAGGGRIADRRRGAAAGPMHTDTLRGEIDARRRPVLFDRDDVPIGIGGERGDRSTHRDGGFSRRRLRKVDEAAHAREGVGRCHDRIELIVDPQLVHGAGHDLSRHHDGPVRHGRTNTKWNTGYRPYGREGTRALLIRMSLISLHALYGEVFSEIH